MALWMVLEMAQRLSRWSFPPVRRSSLNASRSAGLNLVESGPTREAIFLAMRRHRASLAADLNGRIWHSAGPPCPDALRTLTMLFTLLSHSDRPLSDLIKSAIL